MSLERDGEPVQRGERGGAKEEPGRRETSGGEY